MFLEKKGTGCLIIRDGVFIRIGSFVYFSSVQSR